jgi:hypothetical protein
MAAPVSFSRWFGMNDLRFLFLLSTFDEAVGFNQNPTLLVFMPVNDLKIAVYYRVLGPARNSVPNYLYWTKVWLTYAIVYFVNPDQCF